MANEIKYIKIKDDLFFNMLQVKELEKKKIETEPQNQFLIFDRSGSMYYYLDDLINVAKKYCRNLPDGSTVSLGYFSGRDQYNLSVPYTLKKEENSVIVTLDTFKEAIGLTCFNQILNKVNEIAGKSSGKSSLFFFTDGCHNTGGYKKDIELELKEWTKYAQISMFVGYGYIDRDMMSFMASTTDGSFVHLSDFIHFEQTLEDFGIAVEDSSPTVPVEILTNEKIIPISLSGKSIIEYTMEDRVVKFKPSKSGFKGLFFLTKSSINGSEELDKLEITAERGLRGLAYVHSQKNDVNTSLEILSFIQDKYLIQQLYNSIAPEEFSSAEHKIRQSIFSPKHRYLEGQVANFLPDPNAFCVLDAINILAQDSTAKMYTRDKDFDYVKIGKGTEQLDGSNIQYPDDLSVSLNNIVMNQKRLNYSISTSAQATVNLDPKNFKNEPYTVEDLKNHDISIDFPITVYRTYTIIADGRLQTKKLVVSDLSKETLNTLGPILNRRSDGKYILDLTTLPIINKSYIHMTSAQALATKIWEEKLLMDQISLFNFYKKETEEKLGKKSLKQTDLSEEAAQFLAKHCYVKNGSYNPPVKAITENDQYDAYSFEIKVEGFTKVQASSVIKKLEEQKNTTPREQIVKEAYTRYRNDKKFQVSGELLLKNIEDKLNDLNKELKNTRKDIQLSKFAIILGNKGKMDEFESRENMSLVAEASTLKGDTVSPTFSFNIEKTIVKI
jgi:hypothetical protein